MKTNKEMEKIVNKMKTLQDNIRKTDNISAYIIIVDKAGDKVTVAENLAGNEEHIFDALLHLYNTEEDGGFIKNVLKNFFSHELTQMLGQKQAADKPTN